MAIEKKFKVSAIVPLFNGEQFISESIESLLSQTCPIDEIIVIDDKSTDQGLKKVQKLAEANQTIKLLRNSSNKGSSHCRNIGIKESSGDYVLFLDQDDYLCANFNDEVRNYLRKQQSNEIVGIHTSYFIIDENGDNSTEYSDKQIQPDEFLGYQFVRNRILSNSGAVIKKNVFEKAGLYDESLKFSQDWDLWLRIGRIGTFCYLNKALTFIRRHSKNTSARIDGFLTDEKRILEKYDLEFIKKTISSRILPIEENMSDFTSILLRLNKKELFEKEIQSLIQKYTEYRDFKFYQGLIFIRNKQFKKAATHFEQIPSNNRFYLAAQNNLAVCNIFLDEFDNATRILNKILSKNLNFKDALKNLELVKLSVMDSKKFKVTTRPLRKILYNYH